MTVPTSDNREEYTGNDATTSFDYAFKIFEDSDLQVYLQAADGTETLLVLNTDYSVSGAGDLAGGSVTYPLSGDPLASDEKLIILRVLDVVQETDLRNQGAYYPQVVEDEFDRSRMIDQQQQEEIDRALKRPAAEDGYDADGRQIKNGAAGTDGSDVVIKSQIDNRFANDVITKTAGRWDGKGLRATNFQTSNTPANDELINAQYLEAYVASVIAGGEGVIPETYFFDGDGSTTVFSTPGITALDPSSYTVTIDGIDQRPGTDYTVDVGSETVTFVEAPPAPYPGTTDNVMVRVLAYKRAISEAQTAIVETSTGIETVPEALDKRTVFVGSVAELEGLSLAEGVSVILTESGKEGGGVIKSGTHKTDPQNGVFVDLANGNYWERDLKRGELESKWFGSLVAALEFASGGSYEVLVSEDSTIDSNISGLSLNDVSVIVKSGATVDVAVAQVIDFSFYVYPGSKFTIVSGVLFSRRDVFVPADYPTIKDAILNEKQASQLGRRVRIVVSDTYEIPGVTEFDYEDLSNIEIESETLPLSGGVIDLAAGYSDDGVFVFSRCKAPILNILVDCKGISGATEAAVRYVENTSGVIKDGAGAINAQWRGLYVTTESSCSAQNTVWDGAGAECIRGSNRASLQVRGASAKNGQIGMSASNATIEAKDADFSGSNSTALIVSGASVVDADGANCSGAGTDALLAEDGSIVSVKDANLSNANNRGIAALTGATVDAFGVDVSGSNDHGLLAVAATIFANESTVSTVANSCGSDAISADKGGKVIASDSTVNGAAGYTVKCIASEVVVTGSQCTNDGTLDDLEIREGGIIKAARATYATAGDAVNSLTFNGIIFD